MQTLWQDLRYGARMLLKQPGFTAAAVLSLALGIGANTAILSVIQAVLLKSLPWEEPDRIILVWGDDRGDRNSRSQVSFTDVADYRAQNRVFEEVTVYGNWRPILSGDGEPERVPAMLVGDGYFKVMRGRPLLGRVFTPEEQEDGKDFVVVLSYGLWQRRFGNDPEIVGKTMLLNSRTYTIVGVMPEGFQSLPASLINAEAEMYRPVAEKYDETQRSSRHLRAIARLKSGVTLQQAQIDMNQVASRLEQAHPDQNTKTGVNLVPLHEDMVSGLRRALLLLFGAVGFVLLIACVNVANLMLARGAARRKEIAIRAALGARRWQLIRQFLNESILLALIGGALGVLFALWGVWLIESLGARGIPLLSGVEIDQRVLGFTMMLSVLSGLLFGIVPAWQFSRPDVQEALKEGSRTGSGGTSRNRLRGALVVTEIALALVLLIGSGLLLRSVLHLRGVNPGFDPQNLLTMNVWLPHAKYPNGEKWTTFYDQIIQRIEALPGVQAAGTTSVLPLSANFDGRGILVESNPKPEGERDDADLYIVTPNYLSAMNIPMLKGRALASRDDANAPAVALVNATMAARLWPGEDPIGKRFKVPGVIPIEKSLWRSVVGVVGDVKQYGLDLQPPMQMYLPQAQFPASSMTLVVRTQNDPANLIAAVRKEILAVDGDQAVFNIATMEELVADSIAVRRLSMLLLGLFSAVALIMAAVGTYGVISYAVTQRTHEIGIRVALGAQVGDVLKLVLQQGMALALIGLVVGLLASLALTQLMKSLLYGVSATDPATFVVVALLLAMVALLACWIPARRAANVDPLVALRYE